MYWSIYETMLLLCGILTAAIAFIPISTIPAKTRTLSIVFGVILVVAALALGNVASVSYPAPVAVAPLFPLLIGGVIVKSALDRRRAEQAPASAPSVLQYGESGHVATPPSSVAVEAPAAPAPAAQVAPPAIVEADPRTVAWSELHVPETADARLAEIAALHPEFAEAIAAHPNAYDGLRDWARGVIASRQG